MEPTQELGFVGVELDEEPRAGCCHSLVYTNMPELTPPPFRGLRFFQSVEKTPESEEQTETPPTDEGEMELKMGEFNEDPDALIKLGILAVGLLERFGTVTLMVDDDGGVSYVNPVHVFISNAVCAPPPGKVPRRTRPIILAGRPQFVDIDEDGTVYEVEYVDKDQVGG